MRSIAPFLFCVPLMACATQSVSYSTVVADVQTAYRVTEIVVNAAIAANDVPATDAAIIKQIETVDDPLIAALSETNAPTTLSALLQDARTLIGYLPPGTVTTDAQVALAIAQAAYATQTPMVVTTVPTTTH